jgi:hypothetical protein
MKKDNHLSWGVTLIFFGVIFLIQRLHVMPDVVSDFLFDFRNYPIYAGIIFLLTNKNLNIGIVLLVIGALLRLSDIIHLTRNFSDYIWPLLLVTAGVVLLISKSKGKR